MFFIPFPMYQVLELAPINTGCYDIVHFVLFIAFFGNKYQARPGNRLSREWT